MWQLTSCIRYLHDLHVWHRDLKSQNVFVSWDNGELVAKVRERETRVGSGGMLSQAWLVQGERRGQ